MNFAHNLGWTLIHSVWEIAGIATLLLLVNVFLRRSRPQLRYIAALVALSLSVALPISTFVALSPRSQTSIGPAPAVSALQAAHTQRAPVQEMPVFGAVRPTPELQPPATSRPLEPRIDGFLPGLVGFWLAGLALMCGRLGWGLFAVRRLRQTASRCVDSRWQVLADSLAGRLRLRRRVPVFLSDGIESAAVIGFFKTIVLLPAAALTRLSLGQVEALLAHEMAHIRRHDALVNLVQSVVETLLFYHPALWWISSVIRTEREHCCDDLAIELVGDRGRYASALVEMEQLRLAPRLAMAANHGSLLARIRRILALPERRAIPASFWLSLAVLLIASLAVAKSAAFRHAPTPTHKQLQTGRVLTADGRPVARAAVYIETLEKSEVEPRVQKTVSAADGSFTFSTTEPGQPFAIYARLVGTGAGSLSVYPDPGPIKVPIVVRLRKIVPLRVRGVDPSGAPVSGLQIGPAYLPETNVSFVVAPEVADDLDATTDRQGWATIDSIPMGAGYELQVPKGPYVAENSRFEVNFRSGEEHTVVVVQPACSIEGVVTLDGQPMPGRKLRWVTGKLLQGEVVTDGEGHFRIDRVPPGHVSILGARPLQSPLDAIVPFTQVIADPLRAKKVEIKLEKGTVVQIAVASSSRRPDPKASVEFQGPHTNRWAETDANGVVKIRLLPGTYSLRIVHGQDFRNGADVTVVVKDQPSQKLLLIGPDESDRVCIRVKVLDADGRPVQTRVWNLDGWSHRSQLAGETNANGECEFWMASSEVPHVSFQAQSGDQFSDRSVGPVNGLALVKLHHVRLGGLQGTVVDTAGRPVRGAWLRLDDRKWFDFTADDELFSGPGLTGQDGHFRCQGMYPGFEGRFLVHAPGFADTISAPFRVKAGETVEFPKIVLQKAAALIGKLRDQHGLPIKHAYVIPKARILLGRGDQFTDSQGNFRIDNLQPGTYEVGFYKGAMETHVRVQTGTDETYTLRL